MPIKFNPTTGQAEYVSEFSSALSDVQQGTNQVLGPVDTNSALNRANSLKAQELGLAGTLGKWQTGLGAVSALGGLYGLYQGKKALDLEKEKFGFQKQATGEDFSAKAKAFNEELTRSGDVGLALAGSTLSPEQKAAARAKTAKYTVDPTSLGGSK